MDSNSTPSDFQSDSNIISTKFLNEQWNTKKTWVLLMRFSILCELLPFFGFLDEWWILLTNLWKTTKGLWTANRDALEFLGKNFIRDSRPLKINLAKKLEHVEKSNTPIGFSYFYRKYYFKFSNLSHIKVIQHLILNLKQGVLLWVFRESLFPFIYNNTWI